MIEVAEAEKIILTHVPACRLADIPLQNTIGMILQEPIFADRDLPPFNRVAMDGIAVNFQSFEAGNRSFKIEGVGAAGKPQQRLNNLSNCLEIMTGAMLPENTDTIIRYEDVSISGDTAIVNIDNCTQHQNIHTKGIDTLKNTQLIEAGCKMSAAEVGIAASVGKVDLKVAVPPKVVVISTGDELVEVDQQPEAYQIRTSNVYKIHATLKQWGLQTDKLHLNDDLKTIKEQLKTAIENYDVLIMSGGVSKGKFDFLPQALEDLQVEKLFHKIKQRPGKPFWFGRKKDVTVFAFPGNPVSSFVCLIRYFKVWLDAYLKATPTNRFKFPLAETINFKPDLTYFLPVKLIGNEQGITVAKPYKGNGSGDFANLINVDGFLELRMGSDIYEEGHYFNYYNFRDF